MEFSVPFITIPVGKKTNQIKLFAERERDRGMGEQEMIEQVRHIFNRNMDNTLDCSWDNK